MPLYFAREREMIVRDDLLISLGEKQPLNPGEKSQKVMCRYRTLGCYPGTGAVRSSADTLEKIIKELIDINFSERNTRIIDHDTEGSMEIKKREGYF